MADVTPPQTKKKKFDEYEISDIEKKARVAWRESPSKKMLPKQSVYAVILRTITWLEGLHTQASKSSEKLIDKLIFTACKEEQSLFRKLLIQMGDPKGSTDNKTATQNPEKTLKSFLALDFDKKEIFDVKKFTPYAAHSLIQRYCRKMYDSYSSKEFNYVKNNHPLEHPGVKDLFRLLPPEIDVCMFANLNFTEMQRTTQRSQIPKYNVSEMNLEGYDPPSPISIQMVAKSTMSRESAKITDKKRLLKRLGDSEEAEKLNILQSTVTLEMLITHQTENGFVFPNSTLFPIYETQTIPGYDLPINAMVLSIISKISLGGQALFCDTLNASMNVDGSLDRLGIQFLSDAFLDKSATIYKFLFERSKTSMVGSRDWDRLDFKKQGEMSLGDISKKKFTMLAVSDYHRPVYAVMLILYYHHQVAINHEYEYFHGPFKLARRLAFLLMEIYVAEPEEETQILWNFVLTYCATWQSLICAGDPLVACKSTEQLHTFCNMIFYHHCDPNAIKLSSIDIMDRYMTIFNASDDIETITGFFNDNKELISSGKQAIEQFFMDFNERQTQIMWQQLLGRKKIGIDTPYVAQEVYVEVQRSETVNTSDEFIGQDVESHADAITNHQPPTPSSISCKTVTARDIIDKMEQGSSCGPNAPTHITFENREEELTDQATIDETLQSIDWNNVKLPSIRGIKKEVMELYDRQVELNDSFTEQFNRRDVDVCILKCYNSKETNDRHKKSPSKICEYCLRMVFRNCDEYLWLGKFDKCYDCVSSFTMTKATTKRNWSTYMKIRNNPYISPTTYVRVVEQVKEKGLKSLQFKKPKGAPSTETVSQASST